MPRKKKKSNMYFDMDVQDAIVRYNQSDNPSERNKIYGQEIHTALVPPGEYFPVTHSEQGLPPYPAEQAVGIQLVLSGVGSVPLAQESHEEPPGRARYLPLAQSIHDPSLVC